MSLSTDSLHGSWDSPVYDIRLAKQGRKTWTHELKCLLEIHETPFNFETHAINVSAVEEQMRLEDEIEWGLEVNSRSKLAFYRKIKHSVGIDGYVTAKWLSKSQRSAIANARAGTS